MNDQQPTMSIADAARQLGCHPRTLCRYAREGLVRYQALWSRRWLVNAEDVNELVRQRTTGAALAEYALVRRHGQIATTTQQETK